MYYSHLSQHVFVSLSVCSASPNSQNLTHHRQLRSQDTTYQVWIIGISNHLTRKPPGNSRNSHYSVIRRLVPGDTCSRRSSSYQSKTGHLSRSLPQMYVSVQTRQPARVEVILPPTSSYIYIVCVTAGLIYSVISVHYLCTLNKKKATLSESAPVQV